ncbi:WecB/TagA/CpsF family glycosyltransferase [Ureibacillus chungkukjangi]|uniref:WecB/TagA/CpsF family glycosyltransferase n=1 Tax=Ureibacillus chungkukjangi TaxID=1202712 RepID=UPI00384E4087
MSKILKVTETDEIYIRKVNKEQIPTCRILGVDIAAINMQWLISFIEENLKLLSGDYICVSNVHTTVLSYESDEYRMIQNSGILAIPDGGPLSTIGKNRGYTSMNRTTGPDFMHEMFSLSEKNNYRHFFYGSTQETLGKLNKKLKRRYPKINIVGMYSPPFRQLTATEDKEIINYISDLKPDFIWIGLGAPKQEIWMSKHKGKINGLMVGVGAGFDYFAGNIKRAPKWMQNKNLEWVYRLLQNPKRLLNRYLRTNSKFLWLIIRGNSKNNN